MSNFALATLRMPRMASVLPFSCRLTAIANTTLPDSPDRTLARTDSRGA